MRPVIVGVLLALFGIMAFAIAWVIAHPAEAAPSRGCGLASYYGSESGRRTANGERFNPGGMTAAMWGVPFGTWLRVTDPRTGRSVVVRINDRGPDRRLGRLLDLSRGAAIALGIAGRGVAPVCIGVSR